MSASRLVAKFTAPPGFVSDRYLSNGALRTLAATSHPVLAFWHRYCLDTVICAESPGGDVGRSGLFGSAGSRVGIDGQELSRAEAERQNREQRNAKLRAREAG